jgi:hypothetical protein
MAALLLSHNSAFLRNVASKAATFSFRDDDFAYNFEFCSLSASFLFFSAETY